LQHSLSIDLFIKVFQELLRIAEPKPQRGKGVATYLLNTANIGGKQSLHSSGESSSASLFDLSILTIYI